jgi:protein-tyrosine phosphatase
MIRALDVDGALNVRDLGGLPTEDGRFTRRGVLIRAGNLDMLSSAGRQRLLDYGLKTVIDVRDEWETERFPDVFARSAEVTYLNLPFIGKRLAADEQWKVKSTSYVLLHELYASYLDACQSQIGVIVAAVAEGEPATVVHCHAGKDRTGLVSALILSAVGVPAPVIAQDYAETNQHIAPLVARWRADALRQRRDMEQFERDVAAAPETILSALEVVKARYGGVTRYLQHCGVSLRQLDHLLAAFVTSDA